MTTTRSVLFAALIAASVFGCHRRHQAVPEPALDTPATEETAAQSKTPQASSDTPGYGTAALNGGGAVGGAAISSAQGRTGTARTRSRPPSQVRGDAGVDENQQIEENAPTDTTNQGIGGGDTYDRNR